MVEKTNVLKTVSFRKFSQWDVKRFFVNQIKSTFPVIPLSELLIEQTEKKKLNKYPEEEFGILGVTNDGGMFDAYTEKGKNIKQPYKFVKNDYIAYNPYRVNVGSIGIKKDSLKNTYISNAYVVFSTKKELLPDYLFLLMHTEKFNKLIKDNTTGSVRQTLSFENICKIAIPVPSVGEQKKIVQNYQGAIALAKKLEKKADEENSSIDCFIFKTLGIKEITKRKKSNSILNKSSFFNLYNWDVKNAILNENPQTLLKSFIYKNIPIKMAFEINPSTQIPKGIGEITFLPMECISDVYGAISEKRTIDSKEKGYTKFKDNDVIFAKITPCMQNGKCAVVRDLLKGFGMGSTEFHVFRAITDEVTPEFLHSLLRTVMFRKAAMSYFTGSSGQQRVSSVFIENLYIPSPPPSLQKEIIDNINQTKTRIEKMRKQAQKLREKAKQEFEREIFE